MTSSRTSHGIEIALQKAPRIAELRITGGASACSRMVLTGMPVRNGCRLAGSPAGLIASESNTVIGRCLRRHS